MPIDPQYLLNSRRRAARFAVFTWQKAVGGRDQENIGPTPKYRLQEARPRNQNDRDTEPRYNLRALVTVSLVHWVYACIDSTAALTV